MLCSKCGEEISNVDRFCRNCGNILNKETHSGKGNKSSIWSNCWILIVLAVLLISIVTYINLGGVSNKPDPNKNHQGNNIVNGGIVVQQDDWVFYIDRSDGSKIYKIHKDGEGKVKLSDDASAFLNIEGGWLYYVNISDNGYIYKMKDDGTNRTKICDYRATHLNIVGDWAYFIESSMRSPKVQRVGLDGSKRTDYNGLHKSDCINVADGWIYLSSDSVGSKDFDYYGKSEYGLYKMTIDGMQKTKLNDDRATFINVLGGWIYYVNLSDEYKIYKTKTDGTERTALSDDKAMFINVMGDWVYYANIEEEGKLYKIRADGTERTKLNDEESIYINTINEWVFYFTDKEDVLCKIHTDGSARTTVK